MDDARNIKDDAENAIDNKILAQAFFNEHRDKRQNYCQDDKQYTDFFSCHGTPPFQRTFCKTTRASVAGASRL